MTRTPLADEPVDLLGQELSQFEFSQRMIRSAHHGHFEGQPAKPKWVADIVAEVVMKGANPGHVRTDGMPGSETRDFSAADTQATSA